MTTKKLVVAVVLLVLGMVILSGCVRQERRGATATPLGSTPTPTATTPAATGTPAVVPTVISDAEIDAIASGANETDALGTSLDFDLSSFDVSL
jgi:hypothetical protein